MSRTPAPGSGSNPPPAQRNSVEAEALRAFANCLRERRDKAYEPKEGYDRFNIMTDIAIAAETAADIISKE